MNGGRLVLTHMYPECEGREAEMLDEAKRVYTGEVTLAVDGMKIALMRKSIFLKQQVSSCLKAPPPEAQGSRPCAAPLRLLGDRPNSEG
jgi:hypothetical protein